MMTSDLYITGLGPPNLETLLDSNLRLAKCDALFAACAYTSIYGAQFLRGIASKRKIKRICLVSDIRDYITHPAALKLGMDSGWRVRVVSRSQGIFHPKVFVGSCGYKGSVPTSPRLLVLGSGNLSKGGLKNNIECGVVQRADVEISGAADTYAKLWAAGTDLNATTLKRYAKAYRERNAKRSSKDLFALGVADGPEPDIDGNPLQDVSVPRDSAIHPDTANASWAGLETFTGDYTLQLEFPKRAALVLRRLISEAGGGATVEMLCDDSVVREVNCNYYPDNGMYRVNIPNEVPGAENARAKRRGIAIIEKVEGTTKKLKLSVIDNSKAVKEVRNRSLALGTIGKTSTRFYGWF